MGLLLGNPKSRTHILISKAANMVAPQRARSRDPVGRRRGRARDLERRHHGGIEIGALVFHMFVDALFYGFLAMAIGAWTGKTRAGVRQSPLVSW